MREGPGWAGHHQGVFPGKVQKGPRARAMAPSSVTLTAEPGTQEVLGRCLSNERRR